MTRTKESGICIFGISFPDSTEFEVHPCLPSVLSCQYIGRNHASQIAKAVSHEGGQVQRLRSGRDREASRDLDRLLDEPR